MGRRRKTKFIINNIATNTINVDNDDPTISINTHDPTEL